MLSAEVLKIATDIAGGYAFGSPQHVALNAVITEATGAYASPTEPSVESLMARAIAAQADAITALGDQLVQLAKN